MGQILGFQRLQITANQIVDLQSIRDDNGVDPEFHAFITLGDDQGEKGLYMIVRIADPTALSALTYHVNHDSGRPGSVLFETAWIARAALTYVRYDKILQEFFTP